VPVASAAPAPATSDQPGGAAAAPTTTTTTKGATQEEKGKDSVEEEDEERKKEEAELSFADFDLSSTAAAPRRQPDRFHVNLKVCLLPGLIDIPKLKDSFTSSTLKVELHKDNIFQRSFHARNVEEYQRLYNPNAGHDPPAEAAAASAAATAAAGKKGGKAAAPAPAAGKKGAAAAAAATPAVPAGADGGPLVKTDVTPITEGDLYLLGCIQRALVASRQIRAHGSVRYRLEQLLSSSNDLLARFARTRQGGQPLEGDDNVVVAVSCYVSRILFLLRFLGSFFAACMPVKLAACVYCVAYEIDCLSGEWLLFDCFSNCFPFYWPVTATATVTAGGHVAGGASREALTAGEVGPAGGHLTAVRSGARQAGGAEQAGRHHGTGQRGYCCCSAGSDRSRGGSRSRRGGA
jgi:hypothetical protein